MTIMTAKMCKIARALAGVALVAGGVQLVSQQPSSTKAAFVPTRFTVVDAGTVGKPEVILLPGLASSRAVWDAEATKLAPNFRLHLVQVNGFAGQPAGPNGGSTELLPAIVDELHGYIAAKGLHPDVMGHSMGGLLTLMLAEKYPTDVHRIVVVDALPFYALLFNPAATVEGTKPIAAGMRSQMLAMPADQYAAMQPMIAAQMVKDPAGQKLVAASSASSDRGVVVEAMIEDLQTDARSGLPAIKVPALVLYEHDPTLQQPSADTYEQTMQAAYKSMPAVKLVRVDDSRHFIMYDQPAKLDAAVEAFLKP